MISISEKNPLFNYYAPKGTLKGVLSIPHSGEHIPEEFHEFIEGSTTELMQDLDFRVHELVDIEKLNLAGIAVIKSNISRITVDLNRSPEKTLFAWKKNSRGVAIIKSSPNDQKSRDLITTFYAPYFEMLKAILYQLDTLTKVPTTIDLHSMPSKATAYHLNITPEQPLIRPSFCVSDKSGLTCTPDFIESMTTKLKDFYPDSTINMPYYGGYLTEFVHEVLPHGNNIQIEISRGLYMDEDKIELWDDKVTNLKKNLTESLLYQYEKYFKKFGH